MARVGATLRRAGRPRHHDIHHRGRGVAHVHLSTSRGHGSVVEPGDIYTDSEGHMSGRTDNRADWQRLRHRLRRHDIIAAVIVESLSRTSQASQAAGYLANRRRMSI
jgi:hypothetical protein